MGLESRPSTPCHVGRVVEVVENAPRASGSGAMKTGKRCAVDDPHDKRLTSAGLEKVLQKIAIKIATQRLPVVASGIRELYARYG